jgi:DNA-binding transcriptional LysR family regulator
MDSALAFDLKMLEVFTAIVEAGGMTAAGQKLGITQSSVSQSLANLETAIGAQLIDRSQRPPVLTPIGRDFYAQTSGLLQQALQLSAQYRKHERASLNHVRIALVDSLATSIGKELIAAVKYRSTQWSLATGQSHQHAQALLNRDVDIIISDDPIASHPELFRQRILREPFVLVVPTSIAIAQGLNAHSLKSLTATADFVRYSQGTVIGRTIEAQLKLWNIHPPTRLTLDNSYAVFEMVRAGIGWSISTPLCLAQMGLLSGEVSCLPIPEGDFYRELTLVARHSELGNLPEQLAKDSVELLRQRVVPLLETSAPWLLARFALGSN